MYKTWYVIGKTTYQLAQDFFQQQLMEKISYHYWISESFEIDSLVLLKSRKLAIRLQLELHFTKLA